MMQMTDGGEVDGIRGIPVLPPINGSIDNGYLVPYVELNGIRTITDVVLQKLWSELERDDLLRKLFHDSSWISAAEFIEIMKKPSNVPVVAIDIHGPYGVAWLNCVEGNSARAHFGFIKRTWGRKSLATGKAILEYWMKFPGINCEFLFDIICGITPSSNLMARGFIKKLGFIEVGEIPKLCKDAHGDEPYVSGVVSYCAR